jgi:hypothetical protein
MANAGSETLLSVPLELTGDWGQSPRLAAAAVMSRMRAVSFSGVELQSDRQPALLRVQANRSGPPAIWLHPDGSRIAWVIVDIGGHDWSKLAYQFGHELGHVLANSWGPQARPAPPCQWLEEALVEAFSIRGLSLLADSWERNPPFAGNASFSAAIRCYRFKVIAGYSKRGDPASEAELGSWFRRTRAALEGPRCYPGPSHSRDRCRTGERARQGRRYWCSQSLPLRSAVPLEDYFPLWQASCRQIQLKGLLPARLRSLFQLA